MARLSLEELRRLIVQALMNSNTSAANAQAVADALVAADADGLASHGAARLPAYADQALSGKVNGLAEPIVEQRASAVLHVDGQSGFAFRAIAQGLERGVERVAESGIVAVGVGRSHHMGAAGYHVERMAKRGLIALAMSNSPAAIAPWGGNRSLFGTNPIAFACPRVNHPPLVVDLSLSKVARGKIKLAADRQEPIPQGWAVDAQGEPTTDAQAALEGSMLPIGDAKGAALVLMVEILAATLTGSNHGYEAGSFFTAEGAPPDIGHFFLLIDPDRFNVDFSARLESLLAAIEAQSGTRLPGQRRLENRHQAAQEGVSIPDVLYEELCRRAEKVRIGS